MSSFDASTGAERWTTCSPPGIDRFLQGADDQRAYLLEQSASRDPSTGAGPQLVALDPTDGTERWRFPISDAAPIPPGTFLAGGVIVVETSTGQRRELAGVDVASGTPTWSVPLAPGARVLAVAERVAIVDGGGPGPVEQTVVTAGGNGNVPPPTMRLTGYDRLTGTVEWTSDVPASRGGAPASAAADGDTIVVSTPTVVALDGTTGEHLWTATTGLDGAAVGHVGDGIVVMGGQGDGTTALSLGSGEVVWTAPGSPPYDDAWAVADGAIHLRDGDDLVAYDLADGAQRFRKPIDATSYCWPWLGEGDRVYTMWWNLEARSTSDGSILWSTDHPTGSRPVGDTTRMISVATTGDLVLVTYTSGGTGGD